MQFAPPSEMRAAVAAHGLEARIGINTGEVVVGGEGETLVTGDAVNVAARLEQAAPNGEIAHRRRDAAARPRRRSRRASRAARAEGEGASRSRRIASLEVIGDAAPIARNLAGATGRARARARNDSGATSRTPSPIARAGSSPFSGLRASASHGSSPTSSSGSGLEPTCSAGAACTTARGSRTGRSSRCWCDRGRAGDRRRPRPLRRRGWRFASLLEARAAERPQVVVIDDLQWAEPVFVDLVEHVADLSRDAPIFLLCVARTELLDTRPGWGGGKLNATSVLLEPLGGGECEALIGNLLGDGQLDGTTRASASPPPPTGNPLFVEEMVAMVRERGGEAEVVVPPTISALLQARIDLRSTASRARHRTCGASRARCSIAARLPSSCPDAVLPELDEQLASARPEGARSGPRPRSSG